MYGPSVCFGVATPTFCVGRRAVSVKLSLLLLNLVAKAFDNNKENPAVEQPPVSVSTQSERAEGAPIAMQAHSMPGQAIPGQPMPGQKRRAHMVKAILLILFGLLLFLTGAVGVLYSSWFQESARRAVVAMMNNRPGTDFALDRLRIWFPLDVRLEGLVWAVDGDTMVAAGQLHARVAPLGLLDGRVDLDSACLIRGQYNMGNADSATMMRIHGDTIRLARSTVRLKPMCIDVSDGLIAGGDFSLWINPNPPVSKDTATASTPLQVNVHRLQIRRLRYAMSLMPTIDSLGATIGAAQLRDARIDLTAQTVDVASLIGHRLDATYLVPDSVQIASTVVAPPDTTSVSAQWTVRVGKIMFDQSSGLYTTHGLKPQPGLDFAYIQADRMTLCVDSFYNRQTTVRLPISITATERCGLTLAAAGCLNITDVGMAFDGFRLTTASGTDLSADGFLGTGDLATDPTVPLRIKAGGSLAAADAALMFPWMATYLRPLPSGAAVSADIDADGTAGKIGINKLTVGIPGVMRLVGNGTVLSMMDPAKLGADISMRGQIGNVNPWIDLLMPRSGLTVPTMRATAHLAMHGNSYTGNLHAATAAGDISLDGDMHGRGPDYAVTARARNFPVNAFMAGIGIGAVTADISAEGHGLDPALSTTHADVHLDIARLEYQGEQYSDIRGTVSLADRHADIDLASGNPGMEMAVTGSADFAPDSYTVSGTINVTDLDLKKLKLSETPARLAFDTQIDASFNTALTDVAATVRLPKLTYKTDVGSFTVDQVTAHLNAADSVTNASVRNRDLYAFFSTPNGLTALGNSVSRVMPVLDGLMAQHRISVVELQKALPEFNLMIDGGRDNAITQMLAPDKITLNSLQINAANDSLIHLDGRVLGLSSPTIRTDTLSLDVVQRGERLDYAMRIHNRPGTFDNFAKVNLEGYFETNRLGITLSQQNIEGKTGYNIGAHLTLDGDSTATLQFDPVTPTIGYQPWTVNDSNFVTYNFRHRHFDADLRMTTAGSHLSIYTEHAHEHAESMHGADEDLVVDIAGIRLQDWLSINPFAPTVKGDLSASMRLNINGEAVTGKGTMALNGLIYGKERVGDIRTDIDLLTNPGGLINADLSLWIDGAQTMTLKGVLNDSTATSPFNLDFSIIHLPLRAANAFVPGIAKLGGALNGTLDVGGDMAKPVLNGWLQFDSATVNVTMLGSTLRFNEARIPVHDNIVTLDNFAITAANENPLTVNGTVDISELSNPQVDLRLKADNLQLIKTTRAPKGANLYGRAFASLDATISGNMRLMRVDAKAGILSGTNVTYIMTDAQNVISSQQQSDMVKFVNFADSAAMVKADSIIAPETMMLVLDAELNIDDNTTLGVDLGSGSDRVQLNSTGRLNYTMSPLNSGRLIGRLNVNGGYARFSPPMMSEKNFSFDEGSYVSFTGDMMNPTLNIFATDRIRANVTGDGQNSRLIYFDVQLGVTGTLNTMNVKFDLSTDDDATVANELATMSPSQRASQAMNLLITNVYSVGSTRGDANMGGNMLYSFLTSQLNSWAAQTIKGVDLSFGINQYDNVRDGSSTQTTSYSYRVSKALFNDRFKIVVGGNYSTDADADENLSQNLVNDISFEYLLNKSGSMLVRIFRHTGFESILEGEITQTGVGFVYKRKINRIGDMFRFITRLWDHRDKTAPASPAPASPVPSPTAPSPTTPAGTGKRADTTLNPAKDSITHVTL